MTQRCEKDDQLLSYLYKEMTAQEAADFEAHLASCPACSAALGRDRTVRAAFQALPESAPSEARWDRMTAELMGQAAPPQQTPISPAGKLLPLRRRKLLGYLFHPAAGVTAAAAAALFVVVARNEMVHLEPASAPPPAPTLSAEAGAEQPAAPAEAKPAELALAPTKTLAKEEEKEPTKEENPAKNEDSAKETKPAPPAHAGKIARMTAPAGPVANGLRFKGLGALGSNKGGAGGGGAIGGAAPATQAAADIPADVSVRSMDDTTVDRRQERSINRSNTGKTDQTGQQGPIVANQMTQVPASPPAQQAPYQTQSNATPYQAQANLPAQAQPQQAPAQVQNAPADAKKQSNVLADNLNQQTQASANRAAAESEVMAEVNEALANQAQGARRDDLEGVLNRRARGGDNGLLQKDNANQAPLPADKPAAAAPLARLRDDLKSGRCKEASDEMLQLLKSQREQVPREDLLLYQQTCQPRPAELDQEQQQVQRSMPKMPMPAPMEKAEKRRAPSKAAAKAKK